MTKAFEDTYADRRPVASECTPTLALMDGNLHLPSNSRLPRNNTGVDRRAVFLDRDGVLVEDVHYLTSSEQLRLLPGAVEALAGLQDRFFIIVVTNQSGIARGFLTEEELMTIHAQLVCLFAAEGVAMDALYYCPHLPEATVPDYATECTCRKPGPGMFLRAAADWNINLSGSFMVGDMPRDADAALAAGITSIMVDNSAYRSGTPVIGASSILEASRLILGAEPIATEASESLQTVDFTAVDRRQG